MEVVFEIDDKDLTRYEVLEAVAKCEGAADLEFIYHYVKRMKKRKLTSEELQQRIKFLNIEIICEE